MKKTAVREADHVFGFDEASELATLEAARVKGMPASAVRVVAWYDRRSRRSHPEVGVGDGKVVSWERSAASSGADVWVELGDGRYIFLCGSAHRH